VGYGAEAVTDFMNMIMKNPHLWGAILAGALIVGFIALLYIWAKNSVTMGSSHDRL